ncbi:HPr-rel-A system PqqD family peptide chaperone [Sphingobium sp. CCH11-B1]|uniref:HPr-rel-A system PqqD family peptide chaperone n=1 Tax=Sphingobium sp. CCH11-B1 TaxID=1768781 RepID=UPI000AF8799A|nr:HPr-rel-A system PqqD family peptide chaperone [Sphingobium sp. CCH11-B1]MEA3390273.1 HPr-rel-A system PqqD family peptide chaperone [Pseudomonadota bacterium]
MPNVDAIIAYRRDAADAVAACALDDLVLLYHRRSGQTHMVISPVPEILAQLADGMAMTADMVHDALARDYDLGERAEAVAEISAHLESLVALGLVRRA